MTTTSTPIASELRDHFDRGGAIEDGIKLVEMLERAIGRAVTPRSANLARGTRLAADWQPSTADIVYATNRGLTRSRIDLEAEKFRNYWTSKTGAGATKRDWPATWRNWIITATEKGNGPTGYRGQGSGSNTSPRRASTGSDAILAGMGRLARRLDERRPPADERRQIQNGADPAGQLDLEPNRAR